MGAGVSGAAYAKASNLRAACNGRLREVWAGIDLLACPSTVTPARPVTPEGLYGPLPSSGFDMAPMRFTAPFDFNGAPTLSVPCGLNREGLPLSLQFVGKHLGEPLLCRIGQAYEQATTWHTLRPPVSPAATRTQNAGAPLMGPQLTCAVHRMGAGAGVRVCGTRRAALSPLQCG